MNKPAPKEPSMDEILSSIRQIIADDDAGGAPRRPSMMAVPDPMQATPAAQPLADQDDAEEDAPLALSATQIVGDEQDEADSALSFDAILADAAAEAPPELVEPEDVTFAPEEPEPEDETSAFAAEFAAEPEPAPSPAAPKPAAFEPPPSRPAPAMPDPRLSADMAEQLLEPATKAAVRGAFTKLGNSVPLGAPGVTIEAMVRDMLRPMLKQWLDENLPSVVERMVEKEIVRASRGE